MTPPHVEPLVWLLAITPLHLELLMWLLAITCSHVEPSLSLAIPLPM